MRKPTLMCSEFDTSKTFNLGSCKLDITWDPVSLIIYLKLTAKDKDPVECLIEKSTHDVIYTYFDKVLDRILIMSLHTYEDLKHDIESILSVDFEQDILEDVELTDVNLINDSDCLLILPYYYTRFSCDIFKNEKTNKYYHIISEYGHAPNGYYTSVMMYEASEKCNDPSSIVARYDLYGADATLSTSTNIWFIIEELKKKYDLEFIDYLYKCELIDQIDE